MVSQLTVSFTQLVAAFLVESFVWGFPNAYGAFLVAYLKDPGFSSQKHAISLLPLVGPLASGIMYCASTSSYRHGVGLPSLTTCVSKK